MTWATLQQLIRIALYAGGSAILGKGIADGEMYQAAISGAVAIGAFIWWIFRERQVIKQNEKAVIVEHTYIRPRPPGKE